MQRARAFFFVCAGFLCLALAYHVGARNAAAQAGGAVVGVVEHRATSPYGDLIVVTQNGDCYSAQLDEFHGVISGQPRALGNFWSAGNSRGQNRANHH